MVMSKKEALKLAKKRLCTPDRARELGWQNIPARETFICIVLDDIADDIPRLTNDVEELKTIIQNRMKLNGFDGITLESWLTFFYGVKVDLEDGDFVYKIMKTRHCWIDSLIKEFS
jgi:hypothetical protein